ncbi:MAG: hypothetical protein KGL15_09445 [Acidobacteriota bacterium]|nr:hypothetical protein [Acidobacteriota bacterium]
MELCEPGACWREVGLLIHRAMVGAGVAAERAHELVPAFRARYVDPTRGWRLFDDTLPALRAIRAAGWRNVLLSNHVPELPAYGAPTSVFMVADNPVADVAGAEAADDILLPATTSSLAAPATAAGTPRHPGPARRPGGGG